MISCHRRMSARPDLATAHPHFTRDADAGLDSYECIEAGEFRYLVQLPALAQSRIHTTNPQGTVLAARNKRRPTLKTLPSTTNQPVQATYKQGTHECLDEPRREAPKTAQTAPIAAQIQGQNQNTPRHEALLVPVAPRLSSAILSSALRACAQQKLQCCPLASSCFVQGAASGSISVDSAMGMASVSGQGPSGPW